MSKTNRMIEQYLLEFDIKPDAVEYYGDQMSLKHLHRLSPEVVCLNRDCSEFKDAEQVRPGDVVYIEDADGDLNSYQIT